MNKAHIASPPSLNGAAYPAVYRFACDLHVCSEWGGDDTNEPVYICR